MLIPNDPWYNNEWHLQAAKLNGPAAWDITVGSPELVVAIADGGVDCTHEDLSCTEDGWNFYDNNNNTSDVNGHGTAVAGTAAALSNNGKGVTSPNWNS